MKPFHYYKHRKIAVECSAFGMVRFEMFLFAKIWIGNVSTIDFDEFLLHFKQIILSSTQNERDSSIRSPNKYVYNHTNVIARFCRGSIPRSCDHGVMSANNTRPCLLSESFVSSSDFITLELKVTESTVLRPLSFTMRYEFVDYLEDGQAIGPDHNCFRKFVSSSIEHREPTLFRSARNIFKFGRGGTRNMR